jgi:hypothetical protein
MSLPGTLYVGQGYAPPPVPVNDPGWTPLSMWWVDWTGTRWGLSDEQQGLVMMRGIRGLGKVAWEHHEDDYAAIAGSYWRDARAQRREHFWPLYVYHDGSTAEFVARDRALSKGFSSRHEGTIYVQHENGDLRSIKARYEKGLDESLDLDPGFFGWVRYGVYLRSSQPFWEGTPIVRSWGIAEPVPFFGAGDPIEAGPPFGIAEATAAGSVYIDNPGDVEIYPTWTLTGPITASGGWSARVGTPGHYIEVPFTIASGEELVIDTTPSRQSALLDGVDVMADLATFDFDAIEPGANVELYVVSSALGDGLVQVAATPLYERAL